jgi:hypothetical protein
VETAVDDLVRLADLIRSRTVLDNEIATLIGRPAERGHSGEYIAARIFGVRLQESASHKGIDGYFVEGPLAGRSVIVKWYGKQESLLDINLDGPCDYYLVMTGPRGTSMTSRGGTRPWVISYVYLFDMPRLIAVLQARGPKIGIATSLRAEDWRQAEIYPAANNPLMILSEQQKRLLALFNPSTA